MNKALDGSNLGLYNNGEKSDWVLKHKNCIHLKPLWTVPIGTVVHN
jgi:hypothetical protein